MRSSFFISWALWEQMSFVLAVVIVIVFGIGFAKLWWATRILKKQEIFDEEKRSKIQEMREGGIVVESKKASPVPFGVRALESGIEVDGIWISRSNSSIPESLKLARANRSSDSSVISTSEGSKDLPKSNRAHMSYPGAGPSPSTRPSHPPYMRTNGGEPLASSGPASRGSSRPISCSAYKPSRSSQLRFSSVNQYHCDEATLQQLEGKPVIQPARLQKQRVSRSAVRVIDSSSDAAADNEKSSGTSSDSDGSLTQGKHDQSESVDVPRKASITNHIRSYTPTKSPMPLTLPVESWSREENWFARPLSNHGVEVTSLFAATGMSPLEMSSTSYKVGRQSSEEVVQSGEPGWSLPFQNQASSVEAFHQPSFGPGGLHVNKTIRKVNSGFEVLPAGTFGTPIEFIDEPQPSAEMADQSQKSPERKPNRLSKKPRISFSNT